MKGYFVFTKAPALLESDCLVSFVGHSLRESYYIGRDAVGVFYCLINRWSLDYADRCSCWWVSYASQKDFLGMNLKCEGSFLKLWGMWLVGWLVGWLAMPMSSRVRFRPFVTWNICTVVFLLISVFYLLLFCWCLCCLFLVAVISLSLPFLCSLRAFVLMHPRYL